jgi:hypothetical protein
MTAFFIEPFEPLFLGPPRSTLAGDSHFAQGLLPEPLTFQGMVRSKLFLAARNQGESAAQARAFVGPPDRLPDEWQLEGPFPAQRAEGEIVPWLPRPLAAGGGPLRLRRPWTQADPNHGLDDRPTSRWLVDRPTMGKGGGDGLSWLPAHDLLTLLAGHALAPRPEHDAHEPDLPPFIRREQHTGLAVDDTRGTALEDHLYTQVRLRLGPQSGLFGALSGPLPGPMQAALTSGLGAAGRGQRAVAFQPAAVSRAYTELMRGEHLNRAEDGRFFWLVLLTPADVDRPWDLQLGYEDVRASPVALRLGQPVVLGGYSMAANRGRPNRSFRSRGSSWLMEFEGGSAETRMAALRAWHGRHVVGPNDDRSFGFGQALVSVPMEREDLHR